MAFLQWQEHGVIFCIYDAQKSRVAEALGTATTVKDLIIQENAYLIAIADIELLDLIEVGDDRGASINKPFPSVARVVLKNLWRT